MVALWIYCLKAGGCLAVFYLFYKWTLSRETLHRFNRILILSALVVAFMLPLCVITFYRELPLVLLAEPSSESTPAAVVSVQSVDWTWWAALLFGLGGVATLGRMLLSLWGVVRVIRRGRTERAADGIVLVYTRSAAAPFSWWHYVVIAEDDSVAERAPVLVHERAHIRLHHSVDLLFANLVFCLQWWNPAMWLLRRELRAIHEYEADEAVLRSGVDARTYQLLLIKKAAGVRWCSVANSFNHSKLKNRITMMLQKRSSRWAGAKALLLLPLSALAVGAFAETVYLVPEDKDTKKTDSIRVVGMKSDSVEVGGKLPATRGVVKRVYAAASSDTTLKVTHGRVIKIRSNASSDPQSDPLFVVNGREISSEEVTTLTPDQIESITVYKDSTAMSKYGAKAKNGVISVSLKTGTTGNQMKVETSGEKTLEDAKVHMTTVTLKDGQPQVDNLTLEQDLSKNFKSLSNKMLVVIDGKKSTYKKLSALKPEQIVVIDIFKGETGVKKYGKEAEYGVVEVKTK